MQVVHIYMMGYSLFLKTIEETFTARNIDYVLVQNELHYNNKIYRFFEAKDLMESKEEAVLLLKTDEKSSHQIKDFPLYQIFCAEQSFTMYPNPIYQKPISKKKLLKQGKNKYKK